MQKLTKTQFKHLHGNGELLLLAVVKNKTAPQALDMVQAKLNEGFSLADYASNTTNYGFIDNANHTCYQDEASNTVYLEFIDRLWDESKSSDPCDPSTVVYLIN